MTVCPVMTPTRPPRRNVFFFSNFFNRRTTNPLMMKLVVLLVVVASTQIACGLRHHRRRDAATGEMEDDDGGGEFTQQQQQKQKSSAPAVFRYQCPRGCFCVPDIVHIELLIVSCRWTNFRPFARFPRSGTKSLSIQCTAGGNDTVAGGHDDNDGDSESEGDNGPPGALFGGFDQLQELRISGCSARGWLAGDGRQQRALFRDVPRLRHLHLTQVASLHQLDAQFFAGLTGLEQLTLSGTELEQLPQDALCALPALQVLNVSWNRLPSASLSLASPAQCQLGQLIMADLSGNRINALRRDELAAFPVLRQMALAANGMEEINSDAFNGVPLLQRLDLSRNRLHSLPPLPPDTLHLDLSHNQLRHIPRSVRELTALKELFLAGNSIGKGAEGHHENEEACLKTQFGCLHLQKYALHSASLEKLDVSWNALRRVPIHLVANSSEALRQFGLAGNAIEQLEPGQMANLSALKQLDFSNNRLRVLPSGVFDGLGELQVLLLDNNSIAQLDVEVFAGMGTKLHSLGMSHNALTELPMAVGRLHRIKRMDFSHNQISKTYKFVLNKLTHLAKLDLGSNSLEAVESYVFSDCSHLAEIVLARNRIQTLSPNSFLKCPRLRRIDLAENRLSKLNGALPAVHTLRWVNLSGNALEELEWSQFPAELLELEVNRNGMRRVAVVGAESAEAGWKLRKLELKGNKLVRISLDSLPPSLEELDMSENQLTQLLLNNQHSIAATLGQLKMVNLRSNHLRTIPRELYEQAVGANAPFGQLWIGDNPLECNCEMEWLLNATIAGGGGGGSSTAAEGTAPAGGIPDIGTTQCSVPLSGERRLIGQTSSIDFLCPYTPQLCNPGCPCCQFQECDCKSRCPPGCHCFRDQQSLVNVVKCEGDAVGADFGIRDLPMQASHILLSGMDIPVLKSHDFLGRERLLELHINKSGIHTIQPSAFNTLNNLRALYLSDNRLNRINGEEGFHTENIRRLDISGNKVTEVDPNLATMMPKLEFLYLADNSLEELPKYLQSPAGGQLRQISLGGNPFRCDCASSATNDCAMDDFDCAKGQHPRQVDVAHWMEANFARVVDPEGMQCVENVTRAKLLNDTTVLSRHFPNSGDDLFVLSMLEFLQEENRTLCIVHSAGIFGISGAVDTMLFFLAMVGGAALLLILFFLAVRWRKFDLPKSSQDSLTKTRLIRSINNSHSLPSSNSPTSVGSSSPTPLAPSLVVEERNPLLAGYDIFVSYNKRDEQVLMEEFCSRLENEGYTLCLLHQCGHYREDGHQHQSINEALNHLVQNCRALIVFMTPEFLRDEWETVQVSMSHRLGKGKLIIYVSDQLAPQMNDFPEELGTIFRKNTRMWRFWPNFNEPSFWDELFTVLRDIYPGDDDPSHIYSEYGTIPPQVPSAII